MLRIPGWRSAWICRINRAAPLHQKAVDLKAGQIGATGAQAVVMSCGSYRLNFMAGAANAQWPARIESLVELAGDNLAGLAYLGRQS